MRETTNTGGLGLKPGNYTFKVSENPFKGVWAGGTPYYEWVFVTTVNGEFKEHKEKVPVWKMGPLLRALGQLETEPDVFDWDTEEVQGLEFDAEIILEADRKDKSKTYPRLANHRKVGSAVAVAKKPEDDEVPF